MQPSDNEPAGKRLAVVAASLFVVNLTLAPGIAFALISWLWLRQRHNAPLLARNHINQAFHVSLRGAALLLIACAIIIIGGGFNQPWTWVMVVIYFTCIHSTLVVCGCLAMARAMSGQSYRFPLIGVPHE